MDTSSAVSPQLLALLLSLHLHWRLGVWAAMDSCSDDRGAPSRCMPKFENVAFNRTVVVSNACGSPPEDYCMQTGSTRSCHRCDAAEPDLSHNADFLTDFHRNEEPTWWQSQSMFYGVQHPNAVNLTLHFGKAFEITYVRLKFYTSRPESFAIYKRTVENGPWLPYQYYSASCAKTYGKDAKVFLRPGADERGALCTDEFSDISPLSGGNVAFSTLEGRPSAYNFDQSVVLQEWVTATDLLISLDRINTFGDEFFKDAKVLRSYFYAIADFSVGGRCKCNGHASECIEAEHGGLVCSCQHHTAGADCQRCHPFYQDRPWARATGDSANECLRCNCSGRSDECAFDVEQYRSTGSGGRCVNCRDNTDGPHCERCREIHHRTSAEEPCLPCNCNVNGSASLQCDARGKCACQPGVTGEKCDTCQTGFHSLGPGGCRPCECNPTGTVDDCSTLDGHCHCKPNVEGQACDRCKPGFFNMQHVDPSGCQPCFCFGHSLACSSSSHYAAVNITSDFNEDQDDWVGEFTGGQEYPLLWKEGEVYLLPLTEEDIGFYKAPEKFLAPHAHVYGQHLSITFTSETRELLPDRITVLLQGSGITLSADVSPLPLLHRDPGLPEPRHTFVVRLQEEEPSFQPRLSAFEFQYLLHNITAIRISNAGGQNYTSQLAGVSLTSAVISQGSTGPPARWVESCSCPPGFAGQFCERCAPGFTREIPGKGPLSTCVPCSCHRHGSCHPETGVCDCSDFTTGTTCEQCVDGRYGNALEGTPNDCLPCPCPERSSCAKIAGTGEVVCTKCPPGQTGMRCQTCEDGYYGDPLGHSGPVRPCARCDCSGNVDFNAVGICDRLTGTCLKCMGHTEGDHCQRCQRGFYGDALGHAAGQKCRHCSCNPDGTSEHQNGCNPQTGKCPCLAHVTGRDCSYCEVGFFNLRPGLGCERCKCNPIGSSSDACHPITGQCVCRPGVDGRLCDVCRAGFFGFSSHGCRACNCDPMGSISMQCRSNGTCPCRPGFVGYKCDKCALNYFQNRASHQCEECPVCYGLIKKQADKLRARLQDLEKLLAHFDCRGRFGKRHQRLDLRVATLHEHESQLDDALPNALEEFLALQEAREAFIKQFSSLEDSTGALLAQLHGTTATLNCSGGVTEGEERGACRALADAELVIGASLKQLQRATTELDNMIIPFDLESGPNKWNVMVNDSRVLMEKHKETADHIEATASRAAGASKRTLALLMDLLRDNSTEEYIGNLTEQITQMQQQKEDLTARANETAAEQRALETEATALQIALGNVTSALGGLAPTDASPSPDPDARQTRRNQTGATIRGSEWGQDLLRRTQDLDAQLRAKDELNSKIRDGLEPLKRTADKNFQMVDGIVELQAQGHEAKALALSSVVTGKEVESETISLHRELENMVMEWPRRQATTKAALKKERLLEEKVLADVRRRVAQIGATLQPTLADASLFSNATREMEHTAQAVAKESKAILTQAKHTRTASAHLGSGVDRALQQLAEHQTLTDQAKSRLTGESEMSLTNVKEKMEAATLQLEAYSVQLTELLSKIDGSVPLERFGRILNETARRLSTLRGSVESPALSAKIRRLQAADGEQRSRLALIEQDLREIGEERDSLRDITLNLPQSCPRPGEA